MKYVLKTVNVKQHQHWLQWNRLIGLDSLTSGLKRFTNHICQVEALPSSRPLISGSNDVRNAENLTPGHFLTGMRTGPPLDSAISSNHRGLGKLLINAKSNLTNSHDKSNHDRSNMNTYFKRLSINTKTTSKKTFNSSREEVKINWYG